jgi:hypothetical protein
VNEDITCPPTERRATTRVADELSRERMARYLPPRLRGVIDKLPEPTTPAGRFAWTVAMRYAIRTNGRGWFKTHAQTRLAAMMNATQEQILDMARTDAAFIAECQNAQTEETRASVAPATEEA